jgi:hypothetical protein
MKKSFLAISTLILSINSYAGVIEYSDFSDTGNLKLNGSSEVIENSFIRLGDAGSFFASDTVNFGQNDSFSTQFTFNFNDQQSGGSDGMVFVIQNQGSDIGATNGSMGYEGLISSIGIEFDTWYDRGFKDSSASHVGINVDGSMESLVSIDTFNLGMGDLDNPKKDWTAWIDYNGATDLLEIFFDDSINKPGESILQYTIDINNIVGDNAYIGFSGSTSLAKSNHDILSWSFESTPGPIDPLDPVIAVPEPTSIFIFGAGLLSMMGIKRRKKINI